MTELARIPAHADNGVSHSTLTAWAEEMTAAAQIARGVAGTPFVPRQLRVAGDVQATTANVAAALLAGQELGLQPMAALRSINIIEGTPALSAVSMRALVLAAGHRMWLVEATNTRAIYHGQHKGETEIQVSMWDMDRARQLGLAHKDNWKKQPKSMLIARATSECARLTAPEELLGLPYSAEELADDLAGVEPQPEPEAPRASRTARRRSIPPPAPAAAQTPGPDAPPPATDDHASDQPVLPDHRPGAFPLDPAPDEQQLITQPQMRALHAGFRDLGVSDRAQRLTEVRDIIGRDIESAKDLYRAEAATVIDELTQRKTRAELAEQDDDARKQADEDAQLEAAYWAETGQQRAAEDDPPLDET